MKSQEINILSAEELDALFRSVGLKMTNQRVAVYREVAESGLHPSVEEVYERVRGYLPAISLNTVYRTLAVLVEKGLLRRPEKSNNKTFYDGNRQEHHHFVCSRCGRVQDVYIDNIENLDVAGIDERVEEIAVQLRGICAVCRAGGAVA